jgi:hypothetical protein
MRIPLLTSGTATADAGGRAVVSIGPDIYGNEWFVEYVSITSTSLQKTRCDVYRDVISDTAFLEASGQGNRDTSDTKHVLTHGNKLVFVWQGATPGSNCLVVARGTQERRG